MSPPALTNANAIEAYLHCRRCLAARPATESPATWSRLDVGYTEMGLQVWCRRCDVNVMHVDYEGATHPADTTRAKDDDATVADTAQREAREESGIATLTLATNNIMDLDRHELHGGFKCAAHWDVGFVALADPSANIAVSDESEDVQWFPVNNLPDNLATGFENRLANVLKQATKAGLGTSNKA